MFDTLVAWIREYFEKFWPIEWVRPWERGVIIHGSWTREVGPGFFLRVPLAGEIVKVGVKPETADCETQYAISQDGTPWLVSISLLYEVDDVVTALIMTGDHLASLVVEAQGIVAKWINQSSDEHITIERLRESCSRSIKYEAKRWGLKVERLSCNNLSQAPVVRLVIDKDA